MSPCPYGWRLASAPGSWPTTCRGRARSCWPGFGWSDSACCFVSSSSHFLVQSSPTTFCAGRKPRRIWLRVAYVVLLAVLFTWVYFVWVESARWRGRGEIRPKDLSRLAETYFAIYMVVQFILVSVLTPASVAGAIAEEKERRTLEFLLATDLRDREILFGKFASRVGSLLLFLLAGMPVLALLQFFGGIDPDLVVAGFVATLMTVLSLSAVALAASVLSRKARDAIALTYLVAVAYVLLSIVVFAACTIPALRWQFDLFGYTMTSEDAAYPFVAGNPFFMVTYVMETRGRGATNLYTFLGHYTLFHTVVIVLFVAWAGWKLRAIALLQTFGSTRRPLLRRLMKRSPPVPNKSKASRRAAVRKPRPEVGNLPILWKEVFVDTGLRLGGFGRVVVLGLVGLSFVPVLLIVYFTFVENVGYRNPGEWWSAARWNEFGEVMNGYLRATGTVVTTLIFLAIAVRGAGALSGERDRHTLDALLTTPLSARAIVWGKWWGCILGMRWAWAWIFGIWVLGLASGGVHPIMFPAAIVSVAVYASGFAWIGLACSVHFKSTLRATMAAIVLSLFAGGGYFLIFVICCSVPMSFMAGDIERSWTRFFIDFFCSFSPPVNLGWLPIHEFDRWETSLSERDIPYAPFWILGLIAWGLLSWALSHKSIEKFRRMANRLPGRPGFEPRPSRLPPPLPKDRRN